MKRIFIVLLVQAVAILSHAQFTKASLQASGLTCSLCSNAVNKALQKLSFIASVESDIKNATFDILFQRNAKVSIDELRDAVEDAGFSVASLKITADFKNLRLLKNEYVRIGDQTFYFLNGDNQLLEGERTFLIVEKNLMTARVFKKFSTALKTESSQSGRIRSVGAKTRVYHVII